MYRLSPFPSLSATFYKTLLRGRNLHSKRLLSAVLLCMAQLSDFYRHQAKLFQIYNFVLQFRIPFKAPKVEYQGKNTCKLIENVSILMITILLEN